MTERPILFSGPMVRAILEGRKTVTRRVVTVPWRGTQRALPYEPYWFDRDGKLVACDDGGKYWPAESVLKPYGAPGDRLWVRETWALAQRNHWPDLPHVIPVGAGKPDGCVYFRASFDRAPSGLRWRPSIHMPRWASRLSLEVVSVRVERLQEISDEDARAEGVTPEDGPSGFLALKHHDPTTPRGAFGMLWEYINGKRAPWASNPWVWRIEFKRLPE